MTAAARRVAVVGGGWAGLAAAVELAGAGIDVTLYEMAAQLGGRARRVDAGGLALDNGQHILIGAYGATLQTMRRVGVDVDAVLLRTPLRLVGPDGHGLAMPPGRPVPALVRAVWRHRGWRRRDRLALLGAAAGWALRGFACADDLSVAQLCRTLPQRVRAELIEPLCVAALNTPTEAASAAVFLRVLRDALFSGPGSADLLLPRRSLSELLPEPAARWLENAGTRLRLGHRVERIEATPLGWRVDDDPCDAVVLATTAAEAARLVAPIDAAWAARAAALRYEPIVTVYARGDGAPLPAPMLALPAGPADASDPAQFVFDLAALSGADARLAFVVSGAAAWVSRGTEATVAATIEQARRQLGIAVEPLRSFTEKRATFACTPGLLRPAATIAPGLSAAGDYVEGSYPATLEGAVRSGISAARVAQNRFRDAKSGPGAMKWT
jgi:squalene-associated FAD-dependent desaturase